ncbi:hypothetical protein HYX14_03990 [Candidatus Woesearchaeota archaeon]|nr:hypothetical protein [Candidatus Woesearchaeota archaeon]
MGKSFSERVALACSQARTKRPKPLEKEDLYSRVIAAAHEIGITNALIVEWGINSVEWYTVAALRERKYGRGKKEKNTDLGYLRKDYDRRLRRQDEPIQSDFDPYVVLEPAFHPTTESFEVNPDPRIFSPGMLDKFYQVLERKGLEPKAYNPVSTLFYTPAEVELSADVAQGKIRPLYCVPGEDVVRSYADL